MPKNVLDFVSVTEVWLVLKLIVSLMVSPYRTTTYDVSRQRRTLDTIRQF